MATEILIPEEFQPWDEGPRTRALRKLLILNTPREDAFDRITKLAAECSRTPISLLSFVDERRLRVKSGFGMSVTELPREHSFGLNVIRERSSFVVLDAKEDPRFALNPLVREVGIRFYAGVPVMLSGHAVGVLLRYGQASSQALSAGVLQRQLAFPGRNGLGRTGVAAAPRGRGPKGA